MRRHSGEGQLNFDLNAVEAAAFVLALRERGLRDAAVLGAMERVPRDLFAPRRFADLSRRDVALPLPLGQTMTAPGPVATMLTALKIEPGSAILEIGAGSGYVSALLARLGGQVVSVERYAALADGAVMRFSELGLARSIEITVRDGLALQTSERFARIILNGALPVVPDGVAQLLAPGGRLVGAVAGSEGPRVVVVTRDENDGFALEFGASLRISPLVAPPNLRPLRVAEA